MTSYKAKDIQVLEGLEPVRRRPGMYIGSTSATGLHHLLWEIMDNSVDEALNGHCDTIEITLNDSQEVTIRDNGRGIPVDAFQKTKKSAMEILFTTLHSGGKFGQGNYKVSGGLHGVGMAVVCALSETLTATSRRDGHEWTQTYSRGKATGKLKKGKAVRAYGTEVTFKPDAKIFPKIQFQPKWILERAESKAFLNKGLKIIVKESAGKHVFQYPNGIQDYIRKITANLPKLNEDALTIEKDDKTLRVETAFLWTSSTESNIISYANAIRTVDGGTHETGFRNGLTKALRGYIERRGLLSKGLPGITGEDVKEGLVAIISVYLQGEVEFQGQTKGRLNSEITSQVEAVVKHSLEHHLNTHPTLGDQIANRVILAAEARIASRQAKDAVHRKTAVSHRLNLPGKLADCATVDKDEAELFICEGDSAGGSSKQTEGSAWRRFETAPLAKTLANTEIQNIISAIGTGIHPKFDYSKLRYGRIIIMTDADVDGAHICTLLLTFFYKHMFELIQKGHIYIAQPPLFRIDAGKKQFYALDEEEKDRIVDTLNGAQCEIGRFKGLGEMPAADLKTTRSLIQVQVENLESTRLTVGQLMGKDAAPRFKFIKEKAEFVQNLDV